MTRITRTINDVTLNGVLHNGHFVTKSEEGYIVFNSNNEQVLGPVAKQGEAIQLIDQMTAQTTEQKQEEKPSDKALVIYVLPPRPGMRTGHVVQAAFVNGVLRTAKRVAVTTCREADDVSRFTIKKAIELGFTWDVPRNIPFASYRTITQLMDRGSMEAKQRALDLCQRSYEYTPGSTQSEQEQGEEELPI